MEGQLPIRQQREFSGATPDKAEEGASGSWENTGVLRGAGRGRPRCEPRGATADEAIRNAEGCIP